MESYQKLKQIGMGSYGVVWKALNTQNGEVVAIKKLIRKKFSTMEDCLNVTEVKSLRKMNHPNIVKLIEIVKENDTLYLVFEYMDCSLYERIINPRKPCFVESDIRNLCFQVFQGLAHMHSNGYFHRDLKPENLLVSNNVIKIADLGQARETNSKPPYTDYITTRWYRAPEVLLYSPVYDSKVDMWAMGAIMAQLFNLEPIFTGDNAMQVMYSICSVIGSPTPNTWLKGYDLANSINYEFPKHPGVYLSDVLPSASRDALNLIATLLSWDPCSRPTAMEALDHPFFYRCYPGLRSHRNVPLVFQKVIKHCKLSNPPRGLKSCVTSSERTRDPICILPEDPFHFY